MLNLRKFKVDPIGSLIILFLIFINLPYLQNTFYPQHDTAEAFQYFYHFYNNLYIHQELAQWMPYSGFGVDGTFRMLLSVFTPPTILALILGWIFGVTNVLLLFKIAMLLEQFVFLAGLYYLSRCLFQDTNTVFFVCIAGIGGIVWQNQMYFNFRVYYLLPLVLYFLVRFYQQEQARWFWLAGITCVGWGMGTNYFFALWIFALTLFSGVLLLHKKTLWKSVIGQTRFSLVLMGVFVLVAAFYIYTMRYASNHLYFPTRPDSRVFDINTFLTYGGATQTDLTLASLLYGFPINLPMGAGVDNTVYSGLLPLVFFLWALPRERNPVFLALLTVTIALILLSLGGVAARIFFYFPSMPIYRHIALVFGFARIFMVVISGYGFKHFMESPPRERLRTTLIICLALFFAADAFRITEFLRATIIAAWESRDLYDNFLQQDISTLWSLIFLSRIAVYVVVFALVALLAYLHRFNRASRLPHSYQGLKVGLILGVMIDLLLFQWMVYKDNPPLTADFHPFMDSVQVHEVVFQPQREWDPVTERQQHAMNLARNPRAYGVQVVAYDFAQFDPCFPQLRVDVWDADVHQLLDALSPVTPESSAAALTILGCESPKLRLVYNSVVSSTDREALQYIRDMEDADNLVVVNHDPRPASPDRAPPSSPRTLPEPLRVIEFSANTLTIDAAVLQSPGAWLVYADAYDPNWRATVDGEEQPIVKAYAAFKAVWLEHGQHRVEFRFHNPRYQLMYTLMLLLGFSFSLFLFISIGSAFIFGKDPFNILVTNTWASSWNKT